MSTLIRLMFFGGGDIGAPDSVDVCEYIIEDANCANAQLLNDMFVNSDGEVCNDRWTPGMPTTCVVAADQVDTPECLVVPLQFGIIDAHFVNNGASMCVNRLDSVDGLLKRPYMSTHALVQVIFVPTSRVGVSVPDWNMVLPMGNSRACRMILEAV